MHIDHIIARGYDVLITKKHTAILVVSSCIEMLTCIGTNNAFMTHMAWFQVGRIKLNESDLPVSIIPDFHLFLQN